MIYIYSACCFQKATFFGCLLHFQDGSPLSPGDHKTFLQPRVSGHALRRGAELAPDGAIHVRLLSCPDHPNFPPKKDDFLDELSMAMTQEPIDWRYLPFF